MKAHFVVRQVAGALAFSALIAHADPIPDEMAAITWEKSVDDFAAKTREACLVEVLAEARRLSEFHAPSGGHRGGDILHVAAAKQMGAGDFLTFDRNQRKLAKVARLKVPQ